MKRRLERWISLFDIHNYLEEIKDRLLLFNQKGNIPDTSVKLLESCLWNVERDFPNQRVVRVDCHRTCKSMGLLFESDETEKNMERILTLHCKLEGFSYKQGMSDLLSPFIYISRKFGNVSELDSDSISFLMFSKFMKWFLPTAFVDEDFIALQCLLNVFRLLLRFADPEMHDFLETNHVCPELYASSWILTLFSRCTKFENVFLIWDKYVDLLTTPSTRKHAKAFPLFNCLVVLIKNRELILSSSPSELPQLMNSLLNSNASSNRFSLFERENVEEMLSLSEEVMKSIPLWFSKIVSQKILCEAEIPSTELLNILEAREFVCCSSEEALYGGVEEFCFLDTRDPRDFQESHIVDSHNVRNLDESSLSIEIIESSSRIIIYGDDLEAINNFGKNLVSQCMPFVVVIEETYENILRYLQKSKFAFLVGKEPSNELLDDNYITDERQNSTPDICTIDEIPSQTNISLQPIDVDLAKETKVNTSPTSIRQKIINDSPKSLRSATSSVNRHNADFSNNRRKEWINLNDWTETERNGLYNVRFFVAKRVLDSQMNTKKCVLGVSDDIITQLARHPQRVEFARTEECFAVKDLVKITSRKNSPDVVIFHFQTPSEDGRLSVEKRAFVVMRPSECIDLVKEKHAQL